MMRKLCIAISILTVAMGSCTKNAGPANGNSVQPNNKLDTLVFMSANINGHLFKTDSAFGYNVKQLNNDSVQALNLLINASITKADSVSSISITVNNFTGPNTYVINPPNVSATWYLNNARHFATSGQIVILSDTAYALIGNFNFVADSIVVANGAFNVLMPY